MSELGRRQVSQNYSYLSAVINTDKILRLSSLKESVLYAFPQSLFPISRKKSLLYERQIHITKVSGRTLGPQSYLKAISCKTAKSPRDWASWSIVLHLWANMAEGNNMEFTAITSSNLNWRKYGKWLKASRHI